MRQREAVGLVALVFCGIALAGYCVQEVLSQFSVRFLAKRLDAMFPPSFDGVTTTSVMTVVVVVAVAAAMGMFLGSLLFLLRTIPPRASKAPQRAAALAALLARGFPEVGVLFCLQLVFGTQWAVLLICISLYTGGVFAKLLDIGVTGSQLEPYRRVRQAGAAHVVTSIAVLAASIEHLIFRACLLRLDSVLRKFVILGVVGGGGVGLTLMENYAYGDMAVVTGICLVLFGAHMLLESLANLAGASRLSLVTSAMRRSALVGLHVVGFGGWTYCVGTLVFQPRMIHLPSAEVVDLGYLLARLLFAAVETASSALAAAIIGLTLGAVIALAASVRLARLRWLPHIVRLALATMRAVPDALLIMLAISMLGFGWSSGAIVLAMLSSITAAKLFADEVDLISTGAYLALRMTGASFTQSLIGGLLPCLTQPLVSIALYQIEHNLRNAVLIGSVGAGGLGYLLVEARNAGSMLALLAAGLLACGLIGLVELLGRKWQRRPAGWRPTLARGLQERPELHPFVKRNNRAA